jgi:hypothetical protein
MVVDVVVDVDVVLVVAIDDVVVDALVVDVGTTVVSTCGVDVAVVPVVTTSTVGGNTAAPPEEHAVHNRGATSATHQDRLVRSKAIN